MSEPSGETAGLRLGLVNYWAARNDFVRAGLSYNQGDPIGGLAEALVATALWPADTVAAAYARARDVRGRRDASGKFGPALGSLPTTSTGKRNPLAVDIAVPWTAILEVVPGLASFSTTRQAERNEWDRNCVHTDRAAAAAGFPLGEFRFADFARLQVKARFAHGAPDFANHIACRFDLVGGLDLPANDLYALVLFSRVDEKDRDLSGDNFVWTAVLLTDQCLRQLDTGVKGGSLGWYEVHEWWTDGLPDGAYDISELLRGISIAGW